MSKEWKDADLNTDSEALTKTIELVFALREQVQTLAEAVQLQHDWLKEINSILKVMSIKTHIRNKMEKLYPDDNTC